jgi:hypothetical protein
LAWVSDIMDIKSSPILGLGQLSENLTNHIPMIQYSVAVLVCSISCYQIFLLKGKLPVEMTFSRLTHK